jgi:hypothetical protein
MGLGNIFSKTQVFQKIQGRQETLATVFLFKNPPAKP